MKLVDHRVILYSFQFCANIVRDEFSRHVWTISLKPSISLSRKFLISTRLTSTRSSAGMMTSFMWTHTHTYLVYFIFHSFHLPIRNHSKLMLVFSNQSQSRFGQCCCDSGVVAVIDDLTIKNPEQDSISKSNVKKVTLTNRVICDVSLRVHGSQEKNSNGYCTCVVYPTDLCLNIFD